MPYIIVSQVPIKGLRWYPFDQVYRTREKAEEVLQASGVSSSPHNAHVQEFDGPLGVASVPRRKLTEYHVISITHTSSLHGTLFVDPFGSISYHKSGAAIFPSSKEARQFLDGWEFDRSSTYGLENLVITGYEILPYSDRKVSIAKQGENLSVVMCHILKHGPSTQQELRQVIWKAQGRPGKARTSHWSESFTKWKNWLLLYTVKEGRSLRYHVSRRGALWLAHYLNDIYLRANPWIEQDPEALWMAHHLDDSHLQISPRIEQDPEKRQPNRMLESYESTDIEILLDMIEDKDNVLANKLREIIRGKKTD